MDRLADNKKIQNIYDSFAFKLNILKNKQLDFLKNLFAAKQKNGLEELRKDIKQ